MDLVRRIPAFALITLLAAAPLAICLGSVRADAAMAMAPGDDCHTPEAGEAPTLCGPPVISSTAPAVGLHFPVALVAAAADAAGPEASLSPRRMLPLPGAAPPGPRPPAWLRNSAFLI